MAIPGPGAEECAIRLTLALPRGEEGPAQSRFREALLAVNRDGLEKDREIWNRFQLGGSPPLLERDASIIKFAKF